MTNGTRLRAWIVQYIVLATSVVALVDLYLLATSGLH
jgi:hypothetical protein